MSQNVGDDTQMAELAGQCCDETEEYFDSLNSALNGGSAVVASVPPHWRNPNLMPIGNGFGFLYLCETSVFDFEVKIKF